jgi:hypothetical protein
MSKLKDESSAIIEAQEIKVRKPTVGLVIGSSGVKAFAALPFMQRLMDLDVQVDTIFGAGGGGLLATLWSSGYNLDQIAKFFTIYFCNLYIIKLKFIYTISIETNSRKIKWNFAKFLIASDGIPVKRFSPSTKPEDLVKEIEKLLN